MKLKKNTQSLLPGTSVVVHVATACCFMYSLHIIIIMLSFYAILNLFYFILYTKEEDEKEKKLKEEKIHNNKCEKIFFI